MKRNIILNPKGDTIVEVLIALVVVGAIIGGAYLLVNVSTNAVRQSQERSDALNLTQTQIEALRTLNSSSFPSVRTIFCMTPPVGSGTAYTVTQFSSSQPPAQFSQYPTACNFEAEGTAQASVEPIYHIYITGKKQGSIIVYQVVTEWYALSNGTNQLSLYYEVN